MRLQHLPQVHARGDAERGQDDVHRRAVGQEGHVFLRQDAGDHALVAVPPRHLVALCDFARLRHPEANQLVDAGRELVFVVAAQDFHVDYLAALAVRDAERGVFDVPRLLAEYGAEQFLFRAQLGFALRGYLAH